MKSRGITLIELLVVVVIIAVTAGLVFPAFARAKQSAKELACIQNVRNLYLATALYREEQNPKVEFGNPNDMGLPNLESSHDILERVSGRDSKHQSPCGRHPRLDEEFGGYGTIYYMPLDPAQFANFARRAEGKAPLWVDPNCSPADTPIRLQYGAKLVIGVFLDGSTAKKQRSDRPFWAMNYYE